MSNSNSYQQRLDASGLECPMPLLKTKLALKPMQPGDVLWVTATDSGSWRDIHKFIELTHHTLINAEDNEGVYQYWIKKGA
ncbi:sulfurtransferase TusA family protein [Bacterioplanoides sp. SCSIO 12839]|uniref:sulfurtransferase TusA family protein n=1 Tax=Bacterioplanoides sp. SCSIO 12839 TaxID=2829569 RepID=UPI00210552F8|nr:sulfurtransferase TusA family protein [Bacterioplanoides sp. SCSIO 12839]UTW49384.1 sulfurtransferase TusA family protein [Bacterioplanoides sp. SCSIO 12839]